MLADECKMANNKYNEACAEAVFQEIGGTTWSTLEKFKVEKIKPFKEHAKHRKYASNIAECRLLLVQLNNVMPTFGNKMMPCDVLRA